MEIKNLFLGYFDAGDHLKFTFPMAFSMTMLSWSMLHYWEAYEAIGELDNAVEQIKWGAEWLARANPRKNELFALVGNPKVDHDYWGRAENFTAHRPTFKVTTGSPGSDVAGEVAAAMAAASLVLRKWGDESSFPDNLMKVCKDFFKHIFYDIDFIIKAILYRLCNIVLMIKTIVVYVKYYKGYIVYIIWPVDYI